MNDILPPPPAVAAGAPRRGGIPVWIFACCGGCLLFFLMIAGCTGWMVTSGIRAFNAGKMPETQDATYAAIIKNSGPPPGFRILQSFDYNFPFMSFRVVAFVPESVQGTFPDAMATVTTMALLVQGPESNFDRENRLKLYESGSMPEAPGFVRMFEGMNNRTPTELVRDMATGTISGKKFPLRYVIPKLNITDTPANDVNDPADPSAKPSNRRNRGGFGGRSAQSLAFVDLTPPDSKGMMTQIMIFQSQQTEITAEFLEEICKNFWPGE